MADTLRDLVIRLGFDVNTSAIPQVDAQLKMATTDAGKFDKAIGGAFARFAGPAALGAAAFKGLGMAKDALVESADAAVEFGRSMASIQTLLPNDQGRVVELRGQIQDLAKATGKSSAEIAAAVNDVLQTFDDSADTMRLAELATRGATASGTDARTAFDLLSTSMLQFGKNGAGAAKETMDMAFAMRQFGKVEIAQMAHGMGLVAGNMKELGGTEKELFAIIGATAGITGPVEESFTQLSSIMTALKTPTKDLQKLYKELGITSIKSAVEQEGLVPLLNRIREHTDGSVESLSKLIPDVRAGRMFGPLTSGLAGRYAEAMQRVAKSTGAAAEADKAFRGGLNKTGTELDMLDAKARTMQENFGTRLGPMQTLWKEAWISMGQTAIDVIDDVVETFDKPVNYLEGNPLFNLMKIVGTGTAATGHLAAGALDLAFGRNTEGYDERQKQRFRDLATEGAQLLGDDTLQKGAGARMGRDHAVALNTVGKAVRDVQTQISQTNTINLTLPEGADAQQFADAFDRAARKNADALARNVQSAASGDSP